MVKLYIQDEMDYQAGIKLYISHFNTDYDSYRASYDGRRIIELTDEQVGVVDTVIALLKEFKNDIGELLTDMRYDIINEGYNSVEESAYKAGYKEALNRISRELL